MNALDELMAEFNGNAGTMPAVNPPESAKVLATQTTPEVAGEPEPPVVETPVVPPTEKPADVKAAEAAKARKPRASRTAATTATAAPSIPEGERAALLQALIDLQGQLPEGITITIVGRA
jgi:hypothetical protein